MSVGDVDLFEIIEAFAAVGVASMRDLGITSDVVNVNGGAIALGHPVGGDGLQDLFTLSPSLHGRGRSQWRHAHRRPTRRSRAPAVPDRPDH